MDALASPRPGYVSIACFAPQLGPLTISLGATPPQLTGGFGGWGAVGRPRRGPISQWDGSDAWHIVLSLMFDGWATDTNVEPAVNLLQRMGAKSPDDSAPPRLRIAGVLPSLPDKPAPEADWVVAGLTMGESLRNDAGLLVRQAVELDLMEFTEDVLLVAAKPVPSRQRKHRVARGDTLKKIAAKYAPKGTNAAGIQAMIRAIKKRNKIRDDKQLARMVGKTIIVPL